ncbi:MAG: response regulator transcription factor [Candidatus Eremiobacteraeota bacterium]|nr:response regulator transcription factor [Candidatus Eremiobacteraeota bacterium]
MLDRTLQVLIADDHPLVRAGVISTLEPFEEFEIAGQACNGDELLQKVQEVPCDLLILDLEMEGPGPSQLIRACHDLQPQMQVLVLSSHVDEKYLAPLKGLELAGYVVKSEAPDCLLQAIRVVAAGSVWFSHSVLQKTMKLSEEERLGGPLQKLTAREAQVLEKIREAKDNQTIADELKLSKQTVRRYATLIYEKLGVKNRVEAIVCSSNQEVVRAGQSSL